MVVVVEDKICFKKNVDNYYYMDTTGTIKYNIRNLPSNISNMAKTFLLQKDPIEFATGIAMGAAFTTLITSIIENTITPGSQVLFRILKGGANNAFGAAGKSFGTEVGGFMTYNIKGIDFKIGKILQAIIIFIVILLIIHYGVTRPINKLKNKLGLSLETKTPCPFCFTQIERKSARCSACTSELSTGWSTPNVQPVQVN